MQQRLDTTAEESAYARCLHCGHCIIVYAIIEENIATTYLVVVQDNLNCNARGI